MKSQLVKMLGLIVTGITVTACAGPGAVHKSVLPLDHGPRAQTTPWSNQQRMQRAEQEARTQAQADERNRPAPDSSLR